MEINRVRKTNGAYVDSYNNKWTWEWLRSTYYGYSLKEAAEDAASTLKGCSNCTNCRYCTECTECNDCFNCTECASCTNCNNCNGCSDCNHCSYCKQCTGCNNSVYCVECTKCLCCGGCIDSKCLEGRLLVNSADFSANYEAPKSVRLYLGYLDMHEIATLAKVAKHFATSFEHGVLHAVMTIVNEQAEKYASYRSSKAYQQGYADGYEGA